MADTTRLWLSDRQVDLVTGDVVRAGETLARLTTKERELLTYLAGRAHDDVERADLLTDVWGYAPTARTRAVDFTVRRLRQKVEADPGSPEHVVTVHGVGYRFEPGTPPDAAEAPARAEALPLRRVEVDGAAPSEVEIVLAAFADGARLVSLVTPVRALGQTVARHVAATLGGEDGVCWVSGGLSALEALVEGAADPGARRLLLRTKTPSLLVLDGVSVEDTEGLEELASTLRAVPDLRVLAVATRRLLLAAEHALTVEPGRDAASDLTELDEAWATLEPSVRQAWAALSVCAGPIDLDGAEALLGADAVDQLDGLQDAGVVATVRAADGVRFQLRDAARRYGQQRLDVDLATARQRRRAFVLGRYASAWMRWLRHMPRTLSADAPELHALWSDPEAHRAERVRAALLLSAVGTSPDEDEARLDAAGQLVDDDHDLQLSVYLLRSRLRLGTGRMQAALVDARQALVEADGRGDDAAYALSGALMGSALMSLGRLREAEEASLAARARARRVGSTAAEVTLLQVVGRAQNELGRREEALSTLREAVHLARLADNPVSLAESLVALGTLHRHARSLGAADKAYESALEVLQSTTGVEVDLARARVRLEAAVLDLERGETRAALGVLEPLAGELGRAGRERWAGAAWLAVAGTRWQHGDLDGAVEGFEHSRSLYERVEDRLHLGLSLSWSGAAAGAAGELDVADAWIEEAREQLEPLGLPRGREVLVACRYHIDKARGRDVEPALTWAREVESSATSWGDVRLALRLLQDSR